MFYEIEKSKIQDLSFILHELPQQTELTLLPWSSSYSNYDFFFFIHTTFVHVGIKVETERNVMKLKEI